MLLFQKFYRMSENIQPNNETFAQVTKAVPLERWDCTASEESLKEYYEKYKEHLATNKRTPKPTLKKIDAHKMSASALLKIENRAKHVRNYIKKNDGVCCYEYDNNYRCDKPIKFGSCFCQGHHNAPYHFKNIRDKYVQEVNRNIGPTKSSVSTNENPSTEIVVMQQVPVNSSEPTEVSMAMDDMEVPQEDNPDEKEVLINDIIIHCKKMATGMQTSRKDTVLSMKECTTELNSLREHAKKLEVMLGNVYEKIGFLDEKIKKIDEKTETNSNQRAEQISQLKKLVDQISEQ